MTYEAICAHQAAMNCSGLLVTSLETAQAGATTNLLRVRMYPDAPEIAAHEAIASSSIAMGRTSDEAGSLGREPARDANKAGMLKNAPIHHVAMIPQPSPKSVGDCVWNTGGWKTVKYSRQIRAVI